MQPVNTVHATGLFLYPLKALENQWFSDVFRGYRKRSVGWHGLIVYICFELGTMLFQYWRNDFAFFRILKYYNLSINYKEQVRNLYKKDQFFKQIGVSLNKKLLYLAILSQCFISVLSGNVFMAYGNLTLALNGLIGYSPASNFIFKVNNRNTWTRFKICSKLTITTAIFFVHFGNISHLVLVFLLLTLSRLMPAGKVLSEKKIYRSTEV